MSVRRRIAFIALWCSVALLAGACSGSGSSSNLVSSGDNQDAASPTNSGDSSELIESPLGDLLGIPLTNDGAAEQYFADLSRNAEVKIAECMLAAGFEYNVVDYGAFATATSTDFDTREFAEQYGFGIASNPSEESFEAFRSFVDPNQEYVANLNEAKQAAYQLALSGQGQAVDSTAPRSFEPGGCQGQAYDEVSAFRAVLEQFGNEFVTIEQAYESDPRIVAASSDWSSCMSEAGYSFSDQEEAEQDVQSRYDAIVRTPGAFVIEQDQVVEPENPNQQEFVFGPQQLNPAFQSQVDGLAIDERAIGLASWECNAPLRQIEDEVRIEYEQRFVDENGDAIRAALGN